MSYPALLEVCLFLKAMILASLASLLVSFFVSGFFSSPPPIIYPLPRKASKEAAGCEIESVGASWRGKTEVPFDLTKVSLPVIHLNGMRVSHRLAVSADNSKHLSKP